MRNLGILTGFTIKFQNKNVPHNILTILTTYKNKMLHILFGIYSILFYVCIQKNPQIQSQSEKFI